MGLGKFVKKTIDVVGTAAKVSVELGADAVGAIAEKVDNNPEKKEKYQKIGKKLGADIKSGTSKFAEDSVDVVDDAVDKGSKLCKDLGHEISEKINNKKNNKPNEGTVGKNEKAKGENYGTIKINDETK